MTTRSLVANGKVPMCHDRISDPDPAAGLALGASLQAHQIEGGTEATTANAAHRLSRLALVDGISGVAEPGGGCSETYARLSDLHTRRRG